MKCIESTQHQAYTYAFLLYEYVCVASNGHSNKIASDMFRIDIVDLQYEFLSREIE